MALKRKLKAERRFHVLLGLVELFLRTGKPIGSNTLKESGFEDVSSATIRNYFSKLEEEGYLIQQHSSGGRFPTSLAYKLYAEHHFSQAAVAQDLQERLQKELVMKGREIAGFLYAASDLLSDLSQCAVFLSAPRFDQDFIIDIKLVGIDANRLLCVLVTDFGIIHTEILHTQKKLSKFSIQRLESYFRFRLTGLEEPILSDEEKRLALHFYNEVLLRHVVGYSNFSSEDVYTAGFSKLLQFPEFREASALASGLSLFEDKHAMLQLLSECMSAQDLRYWIGTDLRTFSPVASECSVLAVPYFIQGKPVGAFALLGPHRIDYPHLFGLLRTFSSLVSQTLTSALYKHKITFRQPKYHQIESSGTSVLGSMHLLSQQ